MSEQNFVTVRRVPLFLLVILSLALVLAACGDNTATVGSAATAGANNAAPTQTPVTTASGLKYIDLAVGSGAQPKKGQIATVNYTGYLENGKVFDSTDEHGQPFKFHVGLGEVIKGWDEGVAGMKVGGKRRLIVPPNLGYGATGTPGGPIPPNATLTFDVELLSVV